MLQITWLLLTVSVYVNCEGYYKILAPGTLQSNSDYHVSVSTHNTNEPSVIQVEIKGDAKIEPQKIEIPPNGEMVLNFKIPKLSLESKYNLTAKGISGIVFENATELNVAAKEKMILIQTDKATYKPGDLIRFRVLILDRNTRPINVDEPIEITITDSGDNRIKQFNKIELTKGVYADELQLSQYPVLGNWIIEVKCGEEKEQKTIEIAKYVLPKFETTIDAPKHVLLGDKLRATIRSKYTYGKPVKGDAIVTIKHQLHYWASSENDKKITKTVPLDGKAHVDFDLSELILKKDENDYSYYGSTRQVTILAEVEEKLTGNKMKAETDVTVHFNKYNIENVDVPFEYVPDKPFKVSIAVKNYDGTPVQDTKNPVKFTLEQNTYYPWHRPIPHLVSPGTTESEKDSTTTVVPQPEEEPQKQTQTVEGNLDENGIVTVEFMITETEEEKKIKAEAKKIEEEQKQKEEEAKKKQEEANKKGDTIEKLIVDPPRYIPRPLKQFSIKAKYQDVEKPITTLNKVSEERETPKDELDVKVQNQKLRLNEDVDVKILTKDPMTYFVYQIIGRGNIIKSERVNLPSETNEHTLKIKPVFQMLPNADLYVYFIKDGNIKSRNIELSFEKQLENKITIDTPEKAKPGEEVDISVTTDPESYVGLLGVDQSVLLLKSGNDLNKDVVFNELSSFKSHAPYQWRTSNQPAESAGLVVLTNAHSPVPQIYITPLSFENNGQFGSAFGLRRKFYKPMPLPAPSSMIKGVSSVITNIRKEFPETWIYEFISTENGNGKITLKKKVPDTITSWVLTGFSINPKTGLGLTDEPRKLRVFQPFFVSTNLPYSVKRGEVINVPVSVFNYMDKNLDAEVTLDNSNKEFEFAEATNDVDESLSEDVKRTKRVTVNSESGEAVSFLIRPKKVGHITLKIQAITPISGDAVEQILLVEPEGVTVFKNKPLFIDLTKSNEFKQDVDIDLPENIVPDSVYAEISVVGDLLGPIIKNLDSLVRMPYGCGEQNMVNFVPNILVLKYLESLGKLTPAIEQKAKKYLEIGYQRELNYKHPDGSYSAFGVSDKNGSTWLTAYVARSFRQADKYTQIDEKVIAQALEFLSKAQDEDGKFIENGHVIDFQHSKDEKKIFLTAFTLWAFLENKEKFPEYDSTIKKGLSYLAKNIESESKAYPLSIASYVLNLAKHDAGKSAIEKLQKIALDQNGKKYWSEKPQEEKKDKKPYSWWEPPTNDVESTSYALLSLLESNQAGDDVLPILRWLVSKRNSLGGYSSTQATVIGLEALIKFSQKFGSTEKGDIEINFNDDQGSKGKITVNDDNSLVLQTHVLPTNSRHVQITANGKGATLAQISYRYNVATAQEEPRFKLEAKLKETKTAEILKMDVCTSFIPKESDKQSNMAVMEVNLPTGYVADQDNLKDLENVKTVKRVETKKGETVVILYFDTLDENQVCVPIEGVRTHKIGKQKPAAIVVYDYYDNTRQATTFYAPPKSSLCDICEGEDCGKSCPTRA